jgi:hypothetical protein
MQTEALATRPLSALPPDVDGKALAPVEKHPPAPRSLADNVEFAAFLNKIADFAFAQSQSPANWERRRKTVQMRKYILGDYCGIFDKTEGWKSSKGDGIYFDPQTATFINTLVASLTKTKPEKQCFARQEDMLDKREAAKVAKKLLDIDDEQLSTPKRAQREWKWNLLAGGETYRVTYYNPAKPGCGVQEEVYEPVVQQGGETVSYCALCGVPAEGQCARCGNSRLDTIQRQASKVTVKKGSRYKQVGDVDYDSPDMLEMTVIGETDDIGEALIVHRSRMIPRCVLEEALGETGLPQTDTPDTMSYKHYSEDAGMKEFELLHYEELWLAPAVYASYQFPQTTELNAGQVPQGTKGRDVIPGGLYFSRIKKKICQVFPQGIKETLSHTVNSIGEGFHGHGEWDLLPLQDQLTEAKSMKMNSMLLDSTQPLLIREQLGIDINNFDNKFGDVLSVSSTYPLEQSLDNAMRRVPAGKIPSEAYQMGEEIKGQMQQSVGAFSTQSDAPDIKAMGTATGISAIYENTTGRRGPALALYAQMEVEQAYQKLEMRQKYWCKKMYSGVAKDLGDDAVKWFMECNIRQDIQISVVPDSWMPKTDTQKKSGFTEFMNIAGEMIVAKGDKRMVDDVLRKANELFGGGLNFANLEADQTEAQLRIDKIREVAEYAEQRLGQQVFDQLGNINPEAMELVYAQTAEMLKIVHPQSAAGGQPDPFDIFHTLPLDVMFDDHGEFQEHYTDYLATAEGRAQSLFVRTLIRQLAEFHIQAEAYRLMKMNEYSKVPQVPDLKADLAVSEAHHGQALDQNADMKAQELEAAGIQQMMAPAAKPE